MANYQAVTRSNYFRVKNEDSLHALVKSVTTAEDGISLWEETGKDGQKYFGFGVYSYIDGIYDPETEDFDMDAFYDGLAKLVADDDVVIIFECGHEKLRYVTGYATVISTRGVEVVNLQTAAIQAAKRLLCNPDYDTVCYG